MTVVIKLQKKVVTSEENFRKTQRRAYSVLHVYTILFLLFLTIYMIVGFVVVNALFKTSSYIVQYSLQAGIEMLLWIVSVVFLWKAHDKSRMLFMIVGGLSLYATYYFSELFRYPMSDGVDVLIRMIYLIFYICKSLTTALMIRKLYQRPILYVWEEYKSSTKGEEAQDEQLIRQLIQANTTQQQKVQSHKKIMHRALHNLRRNAILLFLLLYGSMIAFYLCMFFMRYLFVSDGKGIDYVQRYILLASLFTALVWSIGAILLFLYKRYARWGIYAAWSFEFFRFFFTIASTVSVFQSQHYGMPSILLFIGMELLRYGLLMRFTMLLFRDPFIKAYWKKQRIHTKA